MGSDEQRFPSPLRYPGGKGKIANFLKLLFTTNRLSGAHYVEPYAGGASVALHLLFEEYAQHVHINDINKSVYSFWNAVLNDTDALCARIAAARLSMTEWRRQHNVQLATAPSTIDLAFSTFYLNRTNRSGIVAGGVIGGLNQDGNWKLDARFNKLELIRRIQKIARHRSRISLTNYDASVYLRTVYPAIGGLKIAYLDPPYYVKGSGLYENFYQHDDHVEISEIVLAMPGHWIVSYDNAAQILRLYRGRRRMLYTLSYSAADRYRGDEVMFFSPDLVTPRVSTPARIPTNSVMAARFAALCE